MRCTSSSSVRSQKTRLLPSPTNRSTKRTKGGKKLSVVKTNAKSTSKRKSRGTSNWEKKVAGGEAHLDDFVDAMMAESSG